MTDLKRRITQLEKAPAQDIKPTEWDRMNAQERYLWLLDAPTTEVISGAPVYVSPQEAYRTLLEAGL